MTLGDLLNLVRVNLIDTNAADYRWSNSIILTALVQGVARLNKVRPESRYLNMRLADNAFPITDSANGSYDEATALAYTVLVDERWHEAIMYFAVAKCLEIDSSDLANAQLSANAYAKFEGLALT